MERLVTLSKVIETLGSIKGEKSLQKMMYLVENYGCRLGYQYTWGHFGPISYQLQQEIREVEALGLIDIKYENGIPIYSKTSSGEINKFWKSQHENYEMNGSLIKLLQFINKLGNKRDNPEFLQIMTSLDYQKKHQLIPADSLAKYSSSPLMNDAEESLNQLYDFL